MKIVIVGLGVIGGSYAMALKNANYKDVYGIDTDIKTLRKAKEIGIIKEGYTRGKEVIRQADIIILSLYPDLIKSFIEDNRDNFKDGAIINDVTGIKELFIDEVLSILPENIDFIFGHPMAGREKKGIEYASDEVFKGANYLITITEKNKKANIEVIEKIIYDLGFTNIKIVTPKYHDEIIGFTSQLPHVLAVALINSDEDGRDTGSFIGDSYRDLTRIANINEKLWSQLFLGNKSNLLKSMKAFELEFNKRLKCIEDENKEGLEQLFIKSSKRRKKL
ncbi:MAG: prephenate dehydrogenase [Clostridium sp.]|nr:prephenate dehydrogenase [Clostridium sp.]